MRIYWCVALCGHLLAIYHAIRTIPQSFQAGTRVGWDMMCEWLNRDVKKDIAHFSLERLAAYLRRANLFHVVRQGVRDYLRSHRAWTKQYMKDVDDDVEMLKEFFREKIGRDWRSATSHNTDSKMDMKGVGPWIVIETEMQKENMPGGLQITDYRLQITDDRQKKKS